MHRAHARGSPWAGDPRTALVEVHRPASTSWPTSFTVSAELEFYLLDRDGEPVDQAGYFDDQRRRPAWPWSRPRPTSWPPAACRSLSAHHEGGPGQFELDLGPLDALGLADALVAAKETMRRLADRARAWWPPSWPSRCRASPARACTCTSGPARCCSTTAGRAHRRRALVHRRAAGPRLGAVRLAAPTVNSYRRLHAGPEAPERRHLGRRPTGPRSSG